jgi:UDP-N-acetylmuramate dehydrogenase
MSPKPFKDRYGIWFENFSLKDFHSFRVETSADIFFIPKNQEKACEIVRLAFENSVPIFFLGSGTNLLIRDGGIRGLVVYQGPRFLNGGIKVLKEESDSIDLEVSSRISKAQLLKWSYENDLSGLEFSAGIPGTMGGAVWMNAGTKWGSYSEVIVSVNIFEPKVGMRTFTKSEMGFAYRGHDQKLLGDWSLISSMRIRLNKIKDEHTKKTSLEKINEILQYRGQRQPLEMPNCGSVFKNPENSEKGAGRWIESAKLKGLQRGGALVSLQHANFFHNSNSATGQDIEGLVFEVQQRVYKMFGVKLEPEVIVKGEN